MRAAQGTHRTAEEWAETLTIEPVDPERDAPLLHTWLTHEASFYWQMTDYSEQKVLQYLRDLHTDADQAAWLVRREGEPIAYAETYDPARAVLTEVYEPQPGEVGMHLLVSPAPRDPQRRERGLTTAVMRAVVRHCFDHLAATRIVVEPDHRNTAVLAKNEAVGFRARRLVELPGKVALLSTLDRVDFERSEGVRPAGGQRGGLDYLAAAPATGTPGESVMQHAQRQVVAKALREFSHEHLLEPAVVDEPVDESPRWEVTSPTGTRYVFRAQTMPLHHWAVEEPSVRRFAADGTELPLDAQALIAEFHTVLGIPEKLLGTYLEELGSTITGAALKAYRGGPTARQLATGRTEVDRVADFQQTEATMTEGHPGFVATNGRIGFDLDDVRAYAPEHGNRFRYEWIAARRDAARLDLTEGRTEQQHWEHELGAATLERFRDLITDSGRDPEDYLMMPVHPWQLRHRITTAFAPDFADERLIHLGQASEEFQPQQSIRTAFNRDAPERSYVKTALSIQNMGFLRGLSPEYMKATPAINDWVAQQVRTDPVLREAGFDVLKEVASVGYTGDAYHLTATRNDQQKMLAALWRESPVPRLAPGERLLTMAALLHRDDRGRSVAAELIRRAGIPARQWLREYVDAYLVPVLHCLEVHDLAFMPHGENLILRVREGRVCGAFMKDIGEEAAILGARELPAEIERMRHPIDDAETAQLIFTDVFDGIFRHLSSLLAAEGVLAPGEFWAVVSAAVDDYQRRDLPRRRRLDLHVPEFAHSCLNRLQLRNTLEMVDLQDASGSLIYSGTLRNPLVTGG